MQLGIFVSYTVLLALNSADFCNHFRNVPSNVGFVALGTFMSVCGWWFLLFTAYIGYFFHEPTCVEEASTLEIRNVYRHIFAVMKLASVRRLAFVLLVTVDTAIARTCDEVVVAVCARGTHRIRHGDGVETHRQRLQTSRFGCVCVGESWGTRISYTSVFSV
jgi:hypothetical protein